MTSRRLRGRLAPDADGHSEAMLSYVIKAEEPRSGQVVDPFVALYSDGMAIEPPLNPESLLQLADENAAHSACLDAKADDSVGRGWTLDPTDAPAEGESAADAAADAKSSDAERAYDMLAEALERITPDYTFDELLWQVDWERDTIGWGTWEVVRAGQDAQKAAIAAIYPAPAHTIRCTKDRDVFVQIVGGSTRYFRRFGSPVAINGRTGKPEGQDQQVSSRRTRRNSVSVDDAATELLMFRAYSPRSRWYPVPRWVSAIPAVAELTAIREFNVQFYGSGGVVDRIIHATAGEQAEAQALADSIKSQLDEAGAEGGAHLTIATGGTPGSGIEVKFLVPTVGQRDGQFGKRRGELVEEVLMAHKVPGYRVARAIVGSLGGAPTREMLHTYRTGTIEPRQTILESRLNQQLFGAPGINLQGYVWRLEDLDWDETALDLDIATKATEFALATPDEGRELIGQSPTGLPEMTRFYYKGQPLGQPRPAPVIPGTPGAAALSQLDALRTRAQDRLASRVGRPTTEGDRTAATNGHGADVADTAPVASKR